MSKVPIFFRIMSSMLINKLYPSNHKTAFVLDHSPYFASSSEYPIELDPADKSRGPGFIPIAPIAKSLWTSTIEAVFEYCRIVWDIFPGEFSKDYKCCLSLFA